MRYWLKRGLSDNDGKKSLGFKKTEWKGRNLFTTIWRNLTWRQQLTEEVQKSQMSNVNVSLIF